MAFATYAETVLDPPGIDLDEVLAMEGAVGASMADFGAAGTETYFGVVYGKGGAALLAARQAAGPGPFAQPAELPKSTVGAWSALGVVAWKVAIGSAP